MKRLRSLAAPVLILLVVAAFLYQVAVHITDIVP